MRAMGRTGYGAPEDVLELREIERPAPGDDEVLIRVHATSLNASDLELLTGKPLYGRIWGFFTPRIQVLGSDVAGTVEAVGAGITRLQPGDEVFGDLFESWGGFAEWVCAPEQKLTRKPAGLSFLQAAAIPQSALIALQGLVDQGQLEAGQRVLINGGGGGGGSFAVQLAHHLGAHVTGVDSAGKLELLRSLGADRVIDYAREDCTGNGERYDLILDLVGHHSIGDFRRALAPGGRYLLVGGAMALLFQTLILGSAVSLFTNKKMGLLFHKPNEGLDTVLELFECGAIVPAIDRTYPLSETPQALRYLGDGHARGKVVIEVMPDAGS